MSDFVTPWTISMEFSRPELQEWVTFLFSRGSFQPRDRTQVSSIAGAAQFSSVTHSCPTLWPHGLQHARLPCPSPTSGVYSDSCPLSQWCHPTISFSVIPFCSPSIFPSIRVFSSESVLCIRWPKYWSFGFSISPSNEYSMNIQDWFPLGWTSWISLENRMSNHFSILALRTPWTVWKGWATRKARYDMIFLLFFLYSLLRTRYWMKT